LKGTNEKIDRVNSPPATAVGMYFNIWIFKNIYFSNLSNNRLFMWLIFIQVELLYMM
jgi:hypothetical protein